MNLRNLDLNLLLPLDALLTERSVSRAGQRMGLSQPAMSGSLARLRRQFDDPLMVRVGRELTLTHTAETLIGPVRDILNAIEGLADTRPEFDPSTGVRSFSISGSDYATMILIAPFLRLLATEAPGVSIHLVPRSSDAEHVLQTDSVDLVIEPRELLKSSKYPSGHLFRDRWLCAVDENNHDVGDTLTMAQYLQLPHLIYSIGADQQLNLADQHLAQLGIQRHIEASVESFLLVPFLLEGTPLASLILERIATKLRPATGIRTLTAPVELPDINETMFWHPRHSSDPGHRWMRKRLQAAAKDLPVLGNT